MLLARTCGNNPTGPRRYNMATTTTTHDSDTGTDYGNNTHSVTQTGCPGRFTSREPTEPIEEEGAIAQSATSHRGNTTPNKAKVRPDYM